jgi:tRNA 2-selenouridine synthase
MAITKLTIDEFLSLAKEYPVLDVRSPGEFLHAHIPGAHSLPLFSDEERKVVGTAYKQESKQKAIKLGLDFFGVKMVKMVEEAEQLIKLRSTNYEVRNYENIVLVHCWRGGMRSAGVAWLLDLYGYKVYTLVGGYKVYRKWVLQQFDKDYPIHILGGYTGSGKTEVLQVLKKKKESVIDLEGLANHKGSAFGALGRPAQPSQEMFENLLAGELTKNTGKNEDLSSSISHLISPIWLEDESQRIGNVNIPTPFFGKMRIKKVFFLNIPFDERLDFIVSNYGSFEKDKLVNAIIRIKKRLGGLETKTAVNYLIEDNVRACFAILLHYYDKQYQKGLENREGLSSLLHKVEADAVTDEINALKLLDLIQKK